MRPNGRFLLFAAFAFTVMADPVSSIAYAIEAALAALDGDLASLVPTMTLVVGTIAIVAVTYHDLIRRFPGGGGGPEALGAAFGEGWAFVPLGALLVDFTLTIAVSCAAAASAFIAYAPGLADGRVPIAAGLALVVGAACHFGHRGRLVFAGATIGFVGLTAFVLVRGLGAEPVGDAAPIAGDASLLAVLLAMPLGMALATGLEAPSNAIAELGELDERGKRFFGQATIWLMLAIVGTLTLGMAVLAARLGIGSAGEHSTLLADVARAATGEGASFAAFQAASALLLLAAAASSYIAGSGLLEALARHGRDGAGLLPARFGSTNRFFVPPWGVAALVVAALAIVLVSRGRDQEIVQFYAVAVFTSFLGATLAAAVLSWRDREHVRFALNTLGVVLVALVLVLNFRRLDPIVSLLAAAFVSGGFWALWVRKGRPAGVASVLGRPEA